MQKIFSLLFLFLCTCLAPHYVNASGNLGGIVTDEVTGLPISGALVVLTKGNQQRQTTTTEVNGTYLFSNINPGNSYTVIASQSGYQTQAVGARINNNQTTAVNFALVPTGGTIAGTVTDTSSAPISGATINILQGKQLIQTTTTDGLVPIRCLIWLPAIIQFRLRLQDINCNP